MAKKASKASNTDTTKHEVNQSLKAQLEDIANLGIEERLEAEVVAYEKALVLLDSGALSVRGLKATIEEATERGALPTLAPSTAQYFRASADVRALEGGRSKALKEVMNVTIQGKRAFGGDFENMLEGSNTFADFARKVKGALETKAEAGRKSKGKGEEKPVDIDGIVSEFISRVQNMEAPASLVVVDSEIWEKFIGIIQTMSQARQGALKQARANHPSEKARVKVSA